MLDKELSLRKELEHLPSERLRELLQAETAKAVPDDELVLAVLHILEDREPDVSGPGSAREEAAWQQFRKRVRARKRRTQVSFKSLGKAAALLLVVGLLLAALPQQAEAEGLWDRIARWTEEFFGFFREEETFRLEEYQFRTDHPGLQQLYDTVTELGVTEPVVPMWLPEGYALEEITNISISGKTIIIADFTKSGDTIIYQLSILQSDISEQYMKDKTPVDTYERYNTTYNIIRNKDTWVVAWTKNNIECSIAIDCQEEVLYEIIESIYRWRMNE